MATGRARVSSCVPTLQVSPPYANMCRAQAFANATLPCRHAIVLEATGRVRARPLAWFTRVACVGLYKFVASYFWRWHCWSRSDRSLLPALVLSWCVTHDRSLFFLFTNECKGSTPRAHGWCLLAAIHRIKRIHSSMSGLDVVAHFPSSKHYAKWEMRNDLS